MKKMKSSLYFLLLLLLSLCNGVIRADAYSRHDFPPDFIFGSGTSAYQVEGAANEDGRTPSIWDTFAHSNNGPGGTGDVACDGYHKYKEDVQLMADVGLDAYRFSISWSRLIPNGRGPVNPKGLQYYNNLINELIIHGIQPHVYHYIIMIFHRRLKMSMGDGKDFMDYADVCFREFGDRVSYWTTVNEPNVFSDGSYDTGIAAPQRCSAPFGVYNCSRGNSSTEPYMVAHNILLAHASAVRLYKKTYQDKQHGYIGISIFVYWLVPSTDTKEDKIATQRAIDFHIGALDPLVFGDYPNVMKKIVGSRMPNFTESERRLVKDSFDFIGIIHYASSNVTDNSESLLIENRDYHLDMGAKLSVNSNFTTLDEIPIRPWALQGVLEYFKQAYGNPPIYVYENGQSLPRNSSLEDLPRIKYLNAYIGAVLDAIRNGSNTRGYFTWSFLDVYELLGGYKVGFGLIYVDLDDPQLKRIPKLSASWYSNFLKGRTITLDGVIELEKNKSTVSQADFFLRYYAEHCYQVSSCSGNYTLMAVS